MNLGAEPHGMDTGEKRNPANWEGAVVRSPFTRRLSTRELLRLANSPTGLAPVGCGNALPTRANPAFAASACWCGSEENRTVKAEETPLIP